METFLLGFLLGIIITQLAIYSVATSWLRMLLGLNKHAPGISLHSPASRLEKKMMLLLDILIKLLRLLEMKIGLRNTYPGHIDIDTFKLIDSEFLLEPGDNGDETDGRKDSNDP